MFSSRARAPVEYQPFPNVAVRNSLQAALEIPTLVRLLRLPPGQRILEVGCGRGVGLLTLRRVCRPARLAGVDIDRDLLQVARRRLAQAHVEVELRVADVRELPFADESFDVVVDFGTCYHISEPERALAEIARVLRAGGLFVHETPLSQLLAHPMRSRGRSLPWREAPLFARFRTALLWSSRMKLGAGIGPDAPTSATASISAR